MFIWVIGSLFILFQTWIIMYLTIKRNYVKKLAQKFVLTSQYGDNKDFVEYYVMTSGYYHAPHVRTPRMTIFLLSILSMLSMLGIVFGGFAVWFENYVIGVILIMLCLYSIFSSLQSYFIYTTAHYGDVEKKLCLQSRKLFSKKPYCEYTDQMLAYTITKFDAMAQEISNRLGDEYDIYGTSKK